MNCLLLLFGTLGFFWFSTPVESVYIHKGTTAHHGEFPYFALLTIRDTSDSEEPETCGGTLIHPRWVLTAAHCIFEANSMRVALGAAKEPSLMPFHTEAVAWFPHEHYKDDDVDNDIGLVKLLRPAKGYNIESIPKLAPTYTGKLRGKRLITAGYGETENDTRVNNELHWTEMKVVKKEKCLNRRYRLTSNMLCLASKNPGQGIFDGDSGGPLIMKKGKRDTLVGVASWFTKTAPRTVEESVFTRVSRYRKWIKKIVAKHRDD